MKFSTGTYLLYGESEGLTTMEDIERSLKPSVDENGKAVATILFLKCFRRFVCAAITYAARAQNKLVPFEDEYQVEAWIEEIGYDAIWAAVEQVAPEPESKKKGGIKATQN